MASPSMLAGAQGTSIAHSTLNAVAGDQNVNIDITNYILGSRKDDAQLSSLSDLDLDRRTIAGWLTPLDFNARQAEVFHGRADGTGRWFLESKRFEAWCDSIRETLFCPGIPGAGKTVMASIVIDYLQTRFKDVENVATAYIYLDYKKQSQQTPLSLISSLLKQLIQRHTASLGEIKLFYRYYQNLPTRPVLGEVIKALNKQIEKLSKVFVVVDGLDELSEDNDAREIFMEAVRSLEGPVNLMATSRDLPSISMNFRETNRLEITAHDQDVKKYIKGRIPPWYPKELRELVTREIVSRVDGMFLLARLHMDSLKGKHSSAKVAAALKGLPTGMEDAYDDAMKRIQQQNEDDRALAYRVLSWIAFGKRLLSIDELQCALAVAPDTSQLDPEEFIFEECLVSYCAGLIVINENSRIVSLVNYTTQEYFHRREKFLFPDVHTNITRTCLTYLLFDDFGHGYSDDGKELACLLQRHHLLDYAIRYWGHHARGCAEETEKALLSRFLRSPQRLDCSSRFLPCGPLGSPPTNVSAMHLCAFFGLCQTAKDQLDNGGKAESIDSHHRTPLSWAAERGHIDVVALLVTHKNVGINSRDRFQRTPLWWASWSGHPAVVDLLLAQKAVIVNCADYMDQTPLFWAARNGHGAIVDLLLAHEAIDINFRYIDGKTVLSLAATAGQEIVVRQLLTHKDIDVNSKDNHGRTPLCCAAQQGHQVVVMLLLERKDVDVNSKDLGTRTPLWWAALNGYHATVALLLASGAVDVNSVDNHLETPLSCASWGGHGMIVKELLAHEGIDVNLKDYKGRTPLSRAAERGKEMVVQQLLSHETIDVNLKDEHGCTPLWWAIKQKCFAVVDLLLAHKAIDVNSMDGQGRTLLSWAAMKGKDEVVRRLLAHKSIDVNAKDGKGQTLLSWAAIQGRATMVKQLLNHRKIDVNSRDSHGRVPLSWAAQNGDHAVVNLLLAHEAINVNSRDIDSHGRTPLSWAAQNGDHAVVNLLLTHEAVDVNYRDNDGETPLSLAAWNENHTVMHCLLGNPSIDADCKDSRGRTPLLLAAENGDHVAVQLLLTHEAVDVNFQDSDGRTPLSLAAWNGFHAVVRLLLAHDAIDVNSRDSHGRTPLSWAAISGQEIVVNQLLSHEGIACDVEDDFKRTPLLWAIDRGHDVIVQLLLAHGRVGAI